MYQLPLGKPSLILWMTRAAATSATATSLGLTRTIGPVGGTSQSGLEPLSKDRGAPTMFFMEGMDVLCPPPLYDMPLEH